MSWLVNPQSIPGLDLPCTYEGGVTVQQPKLFGLLQRERVIAIDLLLAGNFELADERLEGRVEVQHFVGQPTVFISDTCWMYISTSTGNVNVHSESGLFRLNGAFSDDGLCIEGRVDLQRFQLMDIAGDFMDRHVVLHRFESDD